MSRHLRLILVGLVSVALALGFTTTGANAAPGPTSAPRAATTQSCLSAQGFDLSAASKADQAKKKFKKAKKKFKKAVKAFKATKSVKNRKAQTKAKTKKKKAKKAYRRAQKARTATLASVSTNCTPTTTTTTTTTPPTTPTTPTTPGSTPGTSPLAPLCAALPQLQALCDATEEIGNTSPLQPLCEAIPQLAPLCVVSPGDLADPEALEDLIDQLSLGDLPLTTLLGIVTDVLASITSGDFQGVADSLGTTPLALLDLLRALGLPIPPTPIG